MNNYLFFVLIIYVLATLSCSDKTSESKINGRAFELTDDFSTRPLELFPIYFFKEETLKQFPKHLDMVEKKVEEKEKSSLEEIKNHLKTLNIEVGKEVNNDLVESFQNSEKEINQIEDFKNNKRSLYELDFVKNDTEIMDMVKLKKSIENRILDMSERYRDKHPKMEALYENLEDVERFLNSNVENIISDLYNNHEEFLSDYNERINRVNKSTDKINALIDEIETKEDILELWPSLSSVLKLSNVSFQNYLTSNMLPPLDVHPYHETLLVEFCNQNADEIIQTDFYGQFNASKNYDFIIAFYNSDNGAKIWKKPIRQLNEINISTKNFDCDNYEYFAKFMMNNPKEETFVLGLEL